MKYARLAVCAVAVTTALPGETRAAGDAHAATALHVQTLFTTRSALLDYARDGDHVAWLGERKQARQTGPLGARLRGNSGEYNRVEAAVMGDAKVAGFGEYNLDSDGGRRVVDTAGDGDVLAFALTHDALDDPECDIETEVCETSSVGGEVRIVRGAKVRILRQKVPPALIAVARGLLAIAPAVEREGVVRLTTLDGKVLRTISVDGLVAGLAVSPTRLAVVVAAGKERRLRIFDVASGAERSSAPLPTRSLGFGVAVSDTHAVASSGRELWSLDIRRSRLASIPRRPYVLRGLSLDGRVVTWGERVGAKGRVLSVSLTG